MRILVLSRYGRMGASSRLRIYQYLPFLESSGFYITIAPLLDDQYVHDLYAGRRKSLLNIVKAYCARIFWMHRTNEYDLVWVEKEFLPWLPAWFELMCLSRLARVVVDYDDAIFHQYDHHRFAIVRTLLGRKIEAVMRRAEIVVVGNRYLAERAYEARAKQVDIVPTVVDTSCYGLVERNSVDTVTVGWIGSPATAHFLHLIAPALRALLLKKNVRFIAVGANAEQLIGLPISVLPWTEANEVALIQQFDIGIMPLPDEPFERGKCGYKLIQCMACGKPVVASPVGANSEIVRDGIDGLLAISHSDWVEALTRLIDDQALRSRMGNAGRERVEASYSLHTTAPRFECLLRAVTELPE